jgi:hypothetical protein
VPIKRLLPGLLLISVLILIAACYMSANLAPPDPPPDPLAVTPVDTASYTLIVTVGIDEDQDASDHMSAISFQFRTNVIEENNYAIFDDQEHVVCNGELLTLNNRRVYTLKVPHKDDYKCIYYGDTKGMGTRPAVPMFDISARSLLAPHQPLVDKDGYKIKYTADSNALACPITADARDGSNTIHGHTATSDAGLYIGPSTKTLNGEGSILLKRICSWQSHAPFDTINGTYQSEASVEVTWANPDP